jgi:8-oxo-dGTP pyrophosphatase MutT (NUDIX family)
MNNHGAENRDQKRLEDLLSRLIPFHREEQRWGTMHLQVAYYLCREALPLNYLSSARAVLFRRESVMVMRDPHLGYHIIPGGRREPGESAKQTLQREILEETGWTLTRCAPFGLIHYHHRTPKPGGYRYPYPDFLHLIYWAEAGDYLPQARERQGYELEATFRPLAQALDLLHHPAQRLLLKAAIDARADPGPSSGPAG